jgi:hypothetical protein
LWLSAAEELIAQLLEFCLKGRNCGASFGVFHFAVIKSKKEGCRIESNREVKEGRKIEGNMNVRGSLTSPGSPNRIVRCTTRTQKL